MEHTHSLSSESSSTNPRPPAETSADAAAAMISEMTLPPEQVAAVKALMAGGTPAAAARAAGVHRATLYRWMKNDEAFCAALEECRQAGRSAVQHQFHAMADDCMDAIGLAVLEGNANVALRVLKLMGVFTPASKPNPGATLTAEAVRQT